MATQLDTKARPKVKSAIARLGRPGRITLRTRTYDVDAGSASASETVLSLAITPPLEWKDNWRSSLTWTKHKAYCMVSAVALEEAGASRRPRKGDGVEWDSIKAMNVHAVEILESGELPCAYILQLEGSP